MPVQLEGPTSSPVNHAVGNTGGGISLEATGQQPYRLVRGKDCKQKIYFF